MATLCTTIVTCICTQLHAATAAKYSSVTDSRPPAAAAAVAVPTVHENNGETASQRWPSSSGSWRQTSVPLSLYNPPPSKPHPPSPARSASRRSASQRRTAGPSLSCGCWAELRIQSAVSCWGFKAIKISLTRDEFTVQCDCSATIDGYFTH